MRYIIRYQDEPKKHWVTIPNNTKVTFSEEEVEKRLKYYQYLSPQSKFKKEVVK